MRLQKTTQIYRTMVSSIRSYRRSPTITLRAGEKVPEFDQPAFQRRSGRDEQIISGFQHAVTATKSAGL